MELSDVDKLAELARIEMTKEEKDELLGDMQEILRFVEQISDVATEEKPVEPGEHRNVMRDDEKPHEGGMYTEDILNEAPKTNDGYVEVKKIL